jgi:hypothetical protein
MTCQWTPREKEHLVFTVALLVNQVERTPCIRRTVRSGNEEGTKILLEEVLVPHLTKRRTSVRLQIKQKLPAVIDSLNERGIYRDANET